MRGLGRIGGHGAQRGGEPGAGAAGCGLAANRASAAGGRAEAAGRNGGERLALYPTPKGRGRDGETPGRVNGAPEIGDGLHRENADPAASALRLLAP